MATDDEVKGFLMALAIFGAIGALGGAGHALMDGLPIGRVIGYTLGGAAMGMGLLLGLFMLRG